MQFHKLLNFCSITNGLCPFGNLLYKYNRHSFRVTAVYKRMTVSSLNHLTLFSTYLFLFLIVWCYDNCNCGLSVHDSFSNTWLAKNINIWSEWCSLTHYLDCKWTVSQEEFGCHFLYFSNYASRHNPVESQSSDLTRFCVFPLWRRTENISPFHGLRKLIYFTPLTYILVSSMGAGQQTKLMPINSHETKASLHTIAI